MAGLIERNSKAGEVVTGFNKGTMIGEAGFAAGFAVLGFGAASLVMTGLFALDMALQKPLEQTIFGE